MATSISSVLVDCLRCFNALTTRAELALYAAEVPTNLWTDELGRLRVWAANIGAHQTGQSSLDYRLRDASHIKAQTLKLLERLRRTLDDAEEFLTRGPEDDDNSSAADEDETELQQVYKGLVDTTDCLFQLSMIIRRPAQHDRLIGTKKLDATVFEPFDRQHVANKHPKAASIVVDRLGTAISRRRAALKYRERHHAKLAKGIERATGAEPLDHTSAADLDERRDAPSTLLSQTIATEFDETHIDYDEAASNSGASQTSYAPSLWENSGRITVPSIPKGGSYGKAFECPYCFFIVTVSNRRSWARHVLKDLMPYICVFPDCPTPNRLYDSRREWFHHLRTKHLPSFEPGEMGSCLLRCGESVPVVLLEGHLGRHLEELALFALPRVDTGDEENSDESQASIARAADLDEASSTSSNEAPGAAESASAAKEYIYIRMDGQVGNVHHVQLAEGLDTALTGTIYVHLREALQVGQRVVLSGMDGPFATNIRDIRRLGSPLPHNLSEKCQPSEKYFSMDADGYLSKDHDDYFSIDAPGIGRAVVGSPLLLVRDGDDEKQLMTRLRAWNKLQEERRPMEQVSEADSDSVVEGIEKPDPNDPVSFESPPRSQNDPEETFYSHDEHHDYRGSVESLVREPVQQGFRVVVSNVADSVSTDDLKQYMSQAGEVLSVVRLAEQSAIVEYATMEQVRQAILKFHDGVLMGLPITVREMFILKRSEKLVPMARPDDGVPEDIPEFDKDGNDTDPDDEESPPGQSHQFAGLESANSPLERAGRLWASFHSEWLPRCNDFLMNPPTTAEERAKAAQELHDGITANIKTKVYLIKPDTTETKGSLSSLLKKIDRVMSRLDEVGAVTGADDAARESPTTKPEESAPIRFTDAMNRQYVFPWELCNKWKGMEALVTQCLTQFEDLAQDFAAGYYDLLGPTKQIIRPQDWEDVIEPGMQITMQMWAPSFRFVLREQDASNLTVRAPMHRRKVPSVVSDQKSELSDAQEEYLPEDIDVYVMPKYRRRARSDPRVGVDNLVRPQNIETSVQQPLEDGFYYDLWSQTSLPGTPPTYEPLGDITVPQTGQRAEDIETPPDTSHTPYNPPPSPGQVGSTSQPLLEDAQREGYAQPQERIPTISTTADIHHTYNTQFEGILHPGRSGRHVQLPERTPNISTASDIHHTYNTQFEDVLHPGRSGRHDAAHPRPNTTPVAFEWKLSGETVYVSCSYDGWNSMYVLLEHQEDWPGKSRVLHLPPGRHRVLFHVDGEVETSPDLPTVMDSVLDLRVNYVDVAAVAQEDTGA
ncbi:hypothetical protein A1O7_06133 [Cladophialophora yegresii CBS 114405]|uniref:RRM domain-containing protein n=1 Tax=Cladophialophora yegresii CBS 114405 TaxID=1182544 RepID=W9WJN1_9EURO|nr:uncharacterized protein A1O7_06133 [Cladophialophora yegresii CBS 114405]EXJ58704.1 hypothetical protein A1O7_06133 [Cladophialophora yegresii CBS 114405]